MDESSQNVDNSTDINSDLDSLAAQKREARRRRILQNTSNRLGKITGRVHEDEPPVSAEELASPEIPANSSPVIEEIFPDPELERDVFVESTHADNQDIFELLRGMNQNPNLGSATLHEQRPEVPETFVIKLIKSKLPIVFIAIIVYLLFAKDAEYLVGSSVFTVLLGWEVLEFVLMGEAAYRGASARANYLGILFVLGGVPQKTSAIVIRALDILNKVLRDVAIFIFIFVLTHLAWSYFVIKDSLSVILDKDFNVQIQENHEEL